MKLKPVVASLVMLGLMAPVFAKGSLLSQQAVIDQNSAIAPICSDGWFNRISVGGVGSIVGIIGNRDPAGFFTKVDKMNRNTSDLYINNFNLLVGAKLSSWSKANLNLAYLGFPNYRDSNKPGSRKHGVVVDEAYVTISDLAKYPFYVVAGKKYVPFGDYADPYIPDVVKSPTQMFTQTNAPTVIAGVTTDFGVYGSLFAFRGETSSKDSSTNVRNFGGKIGYYTHLDKLNVPGAHVNFALSYLNNVWDTMALGENKTPQWEGVYSSEKDSIGGINAHADLAYKAFSMTANFVTALKKMAESTSTKYNDSKFWAADVNADYAFKTLERDSHLGAGIQWSGNGSWLASNDDFLAKTIPQWRLVGEYKINLFKNTDLDLMVAHGKGYGLDSTKADPKATVGLARLMVQL